MECKKVGKSSVYDIDCMLCKKYYECKADALVKEKEIRIANAHNDCKNCEEIFLCKRYSCGVKCKEFTCNLSLDHYDTCDDCLCLQTCINKYCKDVKYICKKDIHFTRCLINELFIKDNEYTFKAFENKIIYNNELLSIKDGNVFNKYFEEVK